ncbi:MAG: hypothetical protein V4850_28485 [Myxococcota bacterium]
MQHPTKVNQAPAIRPTARLVALALALGAMGGCCHEVVDTACIDWEEPSCPAPEVIEGEHFDDTSVNSPGTFWPAHEYLIDGVSHTEPAKCCYEVTRTICTEELH